MDAGGAAGELSGQDGGLSGHARNGPPSDTLTPVVAHFRGDTCKLNPGTLARDRRLPANGSLTVAKACAVPGGPESVQDHAISKLRVGWAGAGCSADGRSLAGRMEWRAVERPRLKRWTGAYGYPEVVSSEIAQSGRDGVMPDRTGRVIRSTAVDCGPQLQGSGVPAGEHTNCPPAPRVGRAEVSRMM